MRGRDHCQARLGYRAGEKPYDGPKCIGRRWPLGGREGGWFSLYLASFVFHSYSRHIRMFR